MKSKLVEALGLSASPVAVVLTDDKPEAALQFKEGAWGCVAATLVAVSRGKTAVFDRRTYGCPGGGVGLGFGNAYEEKCFAIDKLLATGDPEAAKRYRAGSHMAEGERFFASPDLVRRWLARVPITQVPTKYVVMKPLESVTEADRPDLVVFLANPDQLSALVVLTGFSREEAEPPIAPFGGACQSILFGLAEAKRDVPRGVLGFFDISQRSRVPRDILSYTVPWQLFLRMEADVEDSFLKLEDWRELRERQEPSPG
jgi:uncharacterized protein (DUF169 family)